MSLLTSLGTAFLLGLLTPLTAVCVLPLYPGFLAYLSHRAKQVGKAGLVLLSLLVVSGVISFMLLLGLLFTFILEISLTKVIGIVSPIAFGILGIISLLLIFNFDFSRLFPTLQGPTSKNPYLEGFLFGFSFGAIIIPCNPAFIAALFVKGLTTMQATTNIIQFVVFGLGIGAPLIALAAISSAGSQKVIGFLTRHKRAINMITGIIMLGISVYYLFFVFRILG